MHTAITYTSNTVDQTVSTVHLQLGALSTWTRPLTQQQKDTEKVDPAQLQKETDEATAAQQQKVRDEAEAAQQRKVRDETAEDGSPVHQVSNDIDEYGLNGGEDGSGNDQEDVSVASKKRKWNTPAGAGIMPPNLMDYFYQQFIKDQDDKKHQPRSKGKTKSSHATKAADDSSSGHQCMLRLSANY